MSEALVRRRVTPPSVRRGHATPDYSTRGFWIVSSLHASTSTAVLSFEHVFPLSAIFKHPEPSYNWVEPTSTTGLSEPTKSKFHTLKVGHYNA